MRNRAYLFVLIAAALLCMAVGLAFQYLYVASAVRHAAAEAKTANVERSAPSLPQSAVLRIVAFSLPFTLAWTGGLLASVLFMVMSHFTKAIPDADQAANEALKHAHTLLRTQEAVIYGLAKLSDSRDPETGDHMQRMRCYSVLMATALRNHPDFRHVATPGFVKLLDLSCTLHDIGKVGVEDAILRKPGSLTAEERGRMQLHTRVAYECLRDIECRLGSSNFLQMAREIAHSHHERWDGTGYPQGLAGEQIPLAARIVAVADVYDALSTRRVYKPAYPHEECIRIIASEAGMHFDPRIVSIFLEIAHEFGRLRAQFCSSGTEPVEATVPQSLAPPDGASARNNSHAPSRPAGHDDSVLPLTTANLQESLPCSN